MDDQDLRADHISQVAERIIASREFSENAAALGKKYFEAGGLNTIIKNL